MPLSPEEKKDLDTACMRHRLYLLAKYNHNAFVRQVGADKSDATFDDLKKTSRKDAKICSPIEFPTYSVSFFIAQSW